MPGTQPEPSEVTAPRRYLWPKLLLAAVVLGIILAVIWVSREVDRTRQIRENSLPTAGTNSPS